MSDVTSDRTLLAQEHPLRYRFRCFLWHDRIALLHGFAHQVPRRRVGSSRSLLMLPCGDVHVALRDAQAVRVRRAEQSLGQLAPQPRPDAGDQTCPRRRAHTHRARLRRPGHLLSLRNQPPCLPSSACFSLRQVCSGPARPTRGAVSGRTRGAETVPDVPVHCAVRVPGRPQRRHRVRRRSCVQHRGVCPV
uniref:Uncharacterized protein n=1 Tax=Brassica campestris TaxID=3711 RepID=A0A3P6B9G1_BRACM|nr:unnamed protein product [Brassica rapa]